MAKLTEIQAKSPIRKIVRSIAVPEHFLLHRQSQAGTHYIECRANGETMSCRRATKEEVAAL